MKNVILNSNIFDAGRKIIITEEIEDKTIKPGSTGFICYMQQSTGNPFITKLSVVVTKVGKKGKNRLEFISLHVPIFYFKNIESCLDNTHKPFVNIFPENYLYDKIINYTEIDRLGWAVAYSRYIKYLCETKPLPINFWPDNNLNVLVLAGRLCNIFNDNQKKAYEIVEHNSFVTKLLTAGRLIESSLIKIVIEHHLKVAKVEITAVENLLKINQSLAKPIIDNSILTETINYYKNKVNVLTKLHKEKGRK